MCIRIPGKWQYRFKGSQNHTNRLTNALQFKQTFPGILTLSPGRYFWYDSLLAVHDEDPYSEFSLLYLYITGVGKSPLLEATHWSDVGQCGSVRLGPL